MEDRKKCRVRNPHPRPLLPQGEGRNVRGVHYRGGLAYSGLVKFSRYLRQHETEAERFLWKYLRARKLIGLKFRRQHQIGLYIVDFYCHELKLIIELDGKYHETITQTEKDKKRDENLVAQGFIILRYQNQIALYHPEIILNTIKILLPSPCGRGAGGEG